MQKDCLSTAEPQDQCEYIFFERLCECSICFIILTAVDKHSRTYSEEINLDSQKEKLLQKILSVYSQMLLIHRHRLTFARAIFVIILPGTIAIFGIN